MTTSHFLVVLIIQVSSPSRPNSIADAPSKPPLPAKPAALQKAVSEDPRKTTAASPFTATAAQPTVVASQGLQLAGATCDSSAVDDDDATNDFISRAMSSLTCETPTDVLVGKNPFESPPHRIDTVKVICVFMSRSG